LSYCDPYEFDASQLKSWRVLVVEDEEDSLSATLELFRLLKQHVTGVTSGEAALETLSENAFDVLCTDINLPNLSGVELAKRVKASYPSMALVFATGYGSSARSEIGTDVDVLPKPFGLADIARMLVRLAPKLNKR
jgi:CheY-like chemotaxis protein